MSPEAAAGFLSTWGYPAYYLLFVATAFGSPINEDLLILVGGYLLGADLFAWPVAAPIALAGVLSSDAILHLFGRKLRAHSLRRGWITTFIRPGRLRVGTRWFARFGDRVVFFSRFVPGTRIVVFVTAGFRGMPLSRFVLLDGLAALVWVPVLLLLGQRLGERIGGVNHALGWLGGRILWVIVAIILIAVARQVWFTRTRVRRTGGEDEA
jgi:membrane protein DedA with SNARE-associated domain